MLGWVICRLAAALLLAVSVLSTICRGPLLRIRSLKTCPQSPSSEAYRFRSPPTSARPGGTGRRRSAGRAGFPSKRTLFILHGITLSLILPLSITSRPIPAPSPVEEVQSAWRRAQEAGTYHFATEIVQTTYPAPALVNVGRSSRRDSLHIEGQANVPDRTLYLTLWKGGGSLVGLRDGVEVRVEGDRAYGRPIGGAWQEIDDFTGAFAPDSDLMAYLAGATNVRELSRETRTFPSPADGSERRITFTRYRFDLDGPAFAEYLRRQLEDYLRENGELPAGLTLSVSDQFRRATGRGEVWIDDRGLPLRLVVHLAYPPQRSGERVEADIQTDFWNFGPLLEARSPLTRLAGALGLPRSARERQRAVQQGSMAGGFLGLLLLLLAHRRSRQVYVTFVLVILFSMVVGPLLQSHRVYAFSQRLAAEREAQGQRQEEARAEGEALQEILTSDWDPHRDPLEAQPALPSPQPADLPLAIPPASTSLSDDPPAPDPDSDADHDGLTYAQETILGTDPENPDTDGDAISDATEVQGFEYPVGSGQRWYSDPNNPDSNGDGIADTYECWSTFPPAGSPPYTTPCDKDSDGDGTPDLFDRDNDGDGVSDQVDLSPARKIGDPGRPFDAGRAFELQVDGLQPGYPVIVDIQLRPVQAAHLTYAMNVLDWPSGDQEGQIQRHRDNDSTFADVALANGDTPPASDANGDMRLVPMLEITIPYDGGYGNLPVKPGAPATRDKNAEVDEWLDKAKTDAYGISVRKKDNNGTLLVYVPLNVVADETGGGREAFSARMVYRPRSDTWGVAHQVRVVWLVMMLTDSCKPIPPGTSEEEAATWCDDIANWMLNQQRPVHTYTDEWVLTGLDVREDHGLDVAIAFEDPDGDDNPNLDDHLWLLANGLEAVFITGRDQDRNGVRDVAIFPRYGDTTIASRFDADEITASTTITDRWGIPVTATMQVENFSYPDRDHIATVMMTETVNVLNTYFMDAGQPRADAPTLLFAREERYRGVNLDDASLATLHGARLAVNADPAGAPEMTMAFLSWAPFRYRNGQWESYPINEYWDLLQVRLQDVFPVSDPADMQSVYVAAGQTALARSFYLSMFLGVTRMVRIGEQHVWDLEASESDLSLAREASRLARHIGGRRGGIGIVVSFLAEDYMLYLEDTLDELMTLGFRRLAADLKTPMGRVIALYSYLGEALQMTRHALRWSTIKATLGNITSKLSRMSKARIGGLAAGAILTVGVTVALAAQGETAGQALGVVMSVVSVGMAIKDVIDHGRVFLLNVSRLAVGLKAINTVSESSKKAGIIGLIVSAVAAVGAFIAMWAASGVTIGSLAFNAMLAGTIATIVVAVIMFAISLIPVVGQIIAAVIALIDGVIAALCAAFGWEEGKVGQWFCKGISGLMSEFVKWSIYSSNIMVDMEADDRLDIQNFQQNVLDPAKGISVGNALAVQATVTTTIGLSKIPADWKAAIYAWQYNQLMLRSSTFEYTYQTVEQDIHDSLSLGQITDWTPTDGKKVFIVRQVATDGSGVRLDEPGINRAVRLYLAEGYAIPTQECWALTGFPICYVRWEKATNHIDLGQNLKYDVFPATLDGFYAPVPKDGGYSLAWGQDTTVTNTLGLPLVFPRQKDFDGDGLLNPADSGSDPNDSMWDYDGDGLSDRFELQEGSDPSLYDTDGDGLSDAEEFRLKTDPRRPDTDGDGLTDGEELDGWEIVYGFAADGSALTTWVTSDPLDADADGDTLSDFLERAYGFNPRAYSSPNVLSLTSQVLEAAAPRLLLRFEEPAGATAFADSSGYGNAGTCSGESCPTAGVAGRYGYAVQFNGSGPQPVEAHTSISGPGPFSVAAWVKTDHRGGLYILDQFPPDRSSGYSMEMQSDGRIRWYTRGPGGYGFQVTSSRAINDGNWHHLVGVREANGTGRLYIDGVLDNSAWAVAQDLAAGVVEVGLYFVGTIDEVAVFDHALSQAEVQRLRDGLHNPNDLIVRPGDQLDYQATVENQLLGRYAQGLLSTDFPGLLSDDVPLTTFILEPQGQTTMAGNVQVSDGAPSARMDLTQVAGALITDRREQSNFAELWLRLDEPVTATTFLDYSGALPPRNGTCSGDRCPARQQPGAFGYALYFDGSDDVVTLPDAETLGLYDSSFTVSAWVKGDDFSDSRTVMGTDRQRTNEGLFLGVRDGHPRINFYGNWLQSDITLATGGWYHLAFRYDKATGEMAIFVNGELTAVETGHDAFLGKSTVHLGRAYGGNRFDGYIDDVRVFKRPLSPQEIRTLYIQPVFEMRFEEPPGATSFVDASGFGSSVSCSRPDCPGRATGVNGQAALFDGHDYISVAPNDALSLNDGLFTLALWVYPASGNTYPQGIMGRYFSYENTDSPNGGDVNAYLSLLRIGRQLRFGFGTGSEWIQRTSSEVLTLDAWNHVVLTFGPTFDADGNFDGNVATLYINGQQGGSWNLGDAVPAPSPSTQGFFIGRTTNRAYIDIDSIKVTNENDGAGKAELCMAWNGNEIFNQRQIDDDHGNGQRYDVNVYRTIFNSGTLRIWEDDRDHTGRGERCGSAPDDGDDPLDGGGWTFGTDETSYVHDIPFSGDTEGTVRVEYQNPSIPLRGRIDQLSLYKRALTADEVLELYQAGATGLHLPLDDAPGTSSFDNVAGMGNGLCAWNSTNGGTCPTAGVSGRLNQAVLFDGVNDNIQVNVDVSEQTYGVSLWFQTRCPNCGIFSAFSGALGSGNYNHDRNIYLRNGDLCAQVWRQERICSSGQNYADGEWHHLVHTFGGSVGGQRLYVDGALVASGSKSSSDFDRQTGVNIGYAKDAGHDYFEGRIDDVRVFHRPLAAPDVQVLFHAAPRFQMHLDESTPTCAFQTEYYANTTLSGEPALTGCDTWPINHEWGTGSPASPIGPDDFSVRWSGDFYFDAGTYTFIARTDDGMRVWLDDSLIINGWRDQTATEYRATRTLSQGVHPIKVEYYDRTGDAVAQFWWEPFFMDASGHDNHGACGDSAACPAVGARGRVGLAPQFDGLDDIITVPDDSALDVTTFSVGAWVMPTQLKNEQQVILAKENSTGGERNYSLMLLPNSTRVRFSFQAGDCTTWRAYDSVGELLLNRWNHVMMTYDGQQVNLYINGTLDRSVPLAGTVCQSDTPLNIGRQWDAFTPFVGRIDEVTLYDYALSPRQVREIFLYQGKWAEDRQSHPVTVDADDPTPVLRSVRTDAPDYRAEQDVVMHIEALDPTSDVMQVGLGFRREGQSAFTWVSAPRCMDAPNGAAWCPTFTPSGEGRYTLRASAVDRVGHRQRSPQDYTLYVDGTPPVVTLDAANGSRIDAAPHPTIGQAWLVRLSGTVSDPPLPGGYAGSGLAAGSLRVTLLTPDGTPAGQGTQAATVTGDTWSVEYVFADGAPEGSYTVHAEAADRVGNQTSINLATVYVDAAAPAAHLDLAGIPTATLTGTVTLQGDVTDRPVPLVVSWTTDAAGDESGIEIRCLGRTLYWVEQGAFASQTTYTWDGRVHQGAACQVGLSDSGGDGGVTGTVQVCGTTVATWDGNYGAGTTVPFIATASTCPDVSVAGVSRVEAAFESTLPGSPFYNETPPAGELLHLPFEDDRDRRGNVTFQDVSGQGNDGWCYGALCPTVGATGHDGGAARFDGLDDQVWIRNSAINRLTNDFTVMAWINPDRVTGVQRILGTERWHSVDGFGFFLNGAGLRFATFGVQEYDTTNVQLRPGVWYHVAAVMGADNSVTFYVDGQARQTIAGSAPANPDTDDGLLIGRDLWGNEPFAGRIDEVRVFDRALSADEIKTLYLGAGPLLRLPFETAWAADGTRLDDVSGWEHHGTLHTGADDPTRQAVPGPAGAYALPFDGTDDYVGVAPDAGLDLSRGRFTQMAWVYPTPADDGAHPILGSGAYSEAPYAYPFLRVVNRTALQVGFGDGSNLDTFTTGSILTENTWNHVAVTFDGTTYRIYVNGVERAATDQFAGRTPYPAQRFDIGRDAVANSSCAVLSLREFIPHPRWTFGYVVKFDGRWVYSAPRWPTPDESIPLDKAILFCGSANLEVWKHLGLGIVRLGTFALDTTLGSGSHTFADASTSATLRWDVTADPSTLAYWQGRLDDVRIYPRALSEIEINALYQSRWRETTVAPAGGELASWTDAPPAGLEGSYRLDLRGWDAAGHADNSVESRGAWRGEVDTLAPRLTMTRTIVGPYCRYTTVAQDFSLDADRFETPCGVGVATEHRYFQSPWYAALSGGTSDTARPLYQLTAVCDLFPATLEEVGALGSARVAHAVAVSGTHAYVAAGESGLYVVDVSKPDQPALVGRYDTAGKVLGVDVVGNYVYLADDTDGLVIVDVSDPTHPTLVGGAETPDAQGVAVAGDYAYVADKGNGLEVFDISNPASPVLLGIEPGIAPAYDVAVSGNYAYVAGGSAGLWVLDVSNPSSPTEVASYDTSGNAVGVALSGTHAYVADGQAGLRVIDVSNPSSPTEVGSYDTPGYAGDVALQGGSVYLADGLSGLPIINVSDPTNPQFTDGLYTPGYARGVAVSGDYAYVAAWDYGLRVLSLVGAGGGGTAACDPAGGEQATACDTAGNCTTVTLASAQQTLHTTALVQAQSQPSLTVSILSVPPVLGSLDPVTVTGQAESVTSSLRALTVTVDSTTLYTDAWASGTVTGTYWSTNWTPAGEGQHRLQARVTDWDGNVATDTLTVTVDAQRPSIVITPTLLTTTHYHAPDILDLTGLVTDTVSRPQVRVVVTGTRHFEGSVGSAGGPWVVPWYLGTGPLPDGETYTVTAQATDIAGHTAQVTEVITVDVVPPAPVTLTLTSGGSPLAPGDTLRVLSPTLTLTWTASSDGSGLTDYLAEWTAQTTGTVTTTITAHDPLTRSAQYQAGDGQKVTVQVTCRDVYGQQTAQSIGPVYVDGPTTPDYVVLDDPDGLYDGWMESGCTRVGVDRRVSLNATSRAALSAEQTFYVTWNDEALRLAWTGANWSTDGDLFVYLDVRPGGTITAFNPYSATMTNTVIYLPGATPLSPTIGMAADYLVWVRDSDTALLLNWDGSDWAFGSALSPSQYRFDPALRDGQTDLYLPFDLLGIADPASTPLDLVALASEEDGLRLWAVMPNGNSVDSSRVVETPSEEEHEFALSHRYHWDGLGAGVCPNGSDGRTTPYRDADLRVRLSVEPPGAVYHFLGDGLFDLWNLPPGDRPTDARSSLDRLNADVPLLGDGQVITYTLRYRNAGTDPATGVWVDLSAYDALRLTPGDDHRVVNLGDIGPGEEGTLVFQGVVDTGLSSVRWASVEAQVYDDAHPSSGPPLERMWADHRVDGDGPVFLGLREPAYRIPAGENTLYGYAYDDSGVPRVTVEVQGSGAFACPDGTPQDGQWSCAWDTSSAPDGQVLNLRLRAADGWGQESGWTGWQPFLVDARPPTVTFDVTATGIISGSLLRGGIFALEGDVLDDGGVAGVEVCIDTACEPAVLLTDAPSPSVIVQEDVPSAPIAIDGTTTCSGGEIERTFTVTESFPIGQVSVGFVAAHAHRDDLRVTLESPSGTSVRLLDDDGVSGTNFQNYDLFLDDVELVGLGGLHGDQDPAAPYYEQRARPYEPLQSFRGEDAAGTWTLRICDLNPSTDDGAYTRSRLVLTPRYSAATSGRWSYQVTNDEPLDYVTETISLYGTDAVGNRTADPTTMNVIIDNVAPVITVTQVVSTSVYTATVRVLAGVVSDGGPVSHLRVDVQTPTGEFYSEPPVRSGEAWRYDLHPLTAGTYLLWVTAADRAGNVTTTGPFEVEVIPPPTIYMPMVAMNHVPAPNLVVKRIVATPDNVQVVIQNVGDRPVTDEFWVDVYIAPEAEPTGVNQTWSRLGEQGIVWGVTADALPALTPGGVLTLTVGDAYYWADLSHVAWLLADETQVWAQVDSANTATDYGAVLESHEVIGGEYDNIRGPVDSVLRAAGAASATAGGSAARPAEGHLPPRPQDEPGERERWPRPRFIPAPR